MASGATRDESKEPSATSVSHLWPSMYSRFPLQDTVRLQQWLRNMGRENWTPSRHQYICHEHFAPLCFKVRWGIRYLDSDAVPTVFQEAEVKRKEIIGLYYIGIILLNTEILKMLLYMNTDFFFRKLECVL